ncbi:MAG: nucleotidyl transferase AbiEii/AbiGii toxin family protein [Thermoanaerobaculia bacterium]
MIPADFITEWRGQVPWIQSSQVEQDLVISRALVEIFSDDQLARALAFRGGTALYKLHLTPAPRYSEDIDLVQKTAGPIGPTIDRLRDRLDSWLGHPKRSFKEGRITLVYRFLSEDPVPLPLRLKVEINSREHFSVLGFESRELAVPSRWFSGSSRVSTYALDELLGTKLRALYQRKKGRDLFDLWWASQRAGIDLERVVRCFSEYLGAEGLRVSRAELEANLARKLKDRRFVADLHPLLAPGIEWDLEGAAEWVSEDITPRLGGEPWKGAGRADGGEV